MTPEKVSLENCNKAVWEKSREKHSIWIKELEQKLQAERDKVALLREAVERASKELNEEYSPVSVAHDILDDALEKLKESEGEE